MELYLLRHGIADDGRPGEPDSARQLTAEGRRKTAAVMKAARRAGVNPSLILSSPYDRAMQTARVAAEELGYKGEIVKSGALIPASSPQAVWEEVRAYGGEASILLASHEPLMSQLVAYLLSAPSLQVDVKKSALIRIDFDGWRPAPHGVLRWIVTPALA